MPSINSRHQLLLVIHDREVSRPSNTGLLATQCLTNSLAWIRGVKGEEGLKYSDLADENYENFLLYPSADAQVLGTDLLPAKPIRLIVPDGNWGQGSRTASRIRAQLNVKTVILPSGQTTRYRLRKELHKDGLATFEAIARAFGVLENVQVQEQMEHIFNIFIERNLFMRGQLSREQVYGGISDAAYKEWMESLKTGTQECI